MFKHAWGKVQIPAEGQDAKYSENRSENTEDHPKQRYSHKVSPIKDI